MESLSTTVLGSEFHTEGAEQRKVIPAAQNNKMQVISASRVLLTFVLFAVTCAVPGGDLQRVYDDREGEAKEVAHTPSAGLPLGVQTTCYQPSTQTSIDTCWM